MLHLLIFLVICVFVLAPSASAQNESYFDKTPECANAAETAKAKLFPKLTNDLEGSNRTDPYRLVIRALPSWTPEWQINVVRQANSIDVTIRTLSGIDTSLSFAVPEIAERIRSCRVEDLLEEVQVRDTQRSFRLGEIEGVLLGFRDVRVRPEMKDTVLSLDGTRYEVRFESSLETIYWHIDGANLGAKPSELHPLVKWIFHVKEAIDRRLKSSP